MNFNENLVNERKKCGLSQEELAERIQVSRQSVSKWETGDAMPDFNKLLALADALDISLDELCGREKYTPENIEIKKDSDAVKVFKRKIRFLAAFAVLIAIFICATGIMYMAQNNKEAEKQFDVITENFTVSGAEFFGETKTCLNYKFVPSISGEEFTYKITFADCDGKAYVFDAENNGGICSGTAFFDSNNGGYTVSVSIVSGAFSRNTAVANDLCFNESSCSWTPVTN